MLDRRDINTRRRDGFLFNIDDFENYRYRQDPMYRAMNAWNSLPVRIRYADTKASLRTMLLSSIYNPYKKVE